MGPDCIPKEAAGPYPLRLQAAAEPAELTNVDAEAAAAKPRSLESMQNSAFEAA